MHERYRTWIDASSLYQLILNIIVPLISGLGKLHTGYNTTATSLAVCGSGSQPIASLRAPGACLALAEVDWLIRRYAHYKLINGSSPPTSSSVIFQRADTPCATGEGSGMATEWRAFNGAREHGLIFGE